MGYSKGSIWRKCDIHIHNPASIFNNEFDGKDDTEKWENYIAKLNSIDDLEIIGATNYFCLDGYSELKRLKNDGKLENIKSIFPNIEFRIEQKNKDDEFMNIHVIFSDSCDLSRIENFLNRLELINTSGKGLKKYCNKIDLLEVGFDNVIVPFQSLCEQLSKDFIHRDEYLLCANCRGYGSFRPSGARGRDASYAVEIDKKIDLVFGNNDDTEFFINTRRFNVAIPKPVFKGSDAHKNDDVGNGFTWLKSDTSWEGLKQSIFEPELRIKIQTENPHELETYQKNEKLEFSLPAEVQIKDDEGGISQFCLRGDYKINFSNNLTCITGGRGSGKSTLVHMLYNLKSESPFEKLEMISSPITNLILDPTAIKYLKANSKCNISNSTEFFFQNEVEKSAKNVDKMTILFNQRLERLSSIDGGIPIPIMNDDFVKSNTKFNELIEAFGWIIYYTNSIKIKKEENAELKKQTDTIKSQEYIDLQKNIDSLSSEIARHHKYLEEYNNVIIQIENTIDMVNQLDWTDEEGKEALSKLEKSLTKNKELIQNKKQKYEKIYKSKDVKTLLLEKKAELKKYLGKRNMPEVNISELTEASEKIKQNENEIKSIQSKIQPYNTLYSQKEKLVDELENIYKQYHSRKQELAEKLIHNLEGMNISDKEITLRVKEDKKFITKRVISYLKEISDEQVREDNLYNLLFNDCTLEDYKDNKENIKIRVEKYNGVESTKKIVAELLSNDDILERVHLELLIGLYDINNIKIQTRLGDKPLQNTSFGERCGIVLSIILAIGTNPIIIDQPEDNLDGKFISKTLVPIIRKSKSNRQIIMVTREANIVIGADAELIHILEEGDEYIEIVNSTIEDLKNREKYIWILDGGKEAFKKREQKYNI